MKLDGCLGGGRGMNNCSLVAVEAVVEILSSFSDVEPSDMVHDLTDDSSSVVSVRFVLVDGVEVA